MRKKIICVYSITNIITGKEYIGSSENVHSRWSGHKYKLKKNYHENYKVQDSWNQYGGEAHTFEIVEEYQAGISTKELEDYETFYIRTRKPQLNIKLTATRLAVETLQKIKASNRKHYEEYGPTPEEQRKGYKKGELIGRRSGKLEILEVLEERHNRKKMVKCQCDCGNLHTVYLLNFLRQDRPTTDCGCELFNKRSTSLTGIKRTPEQIEKMAASKRGQKTKPCSEETKTKISTSQKGVPRTHKTRAISEDLIAGKKFGVYIALWLLGERSGKKRTRIWLCQCEQGHFHKVTQDYLFLVEGTRCNTRTAVELSLLTNQ